MKSVTITWSEPTTRTDGTALPASEIAQVEVFQVSGTTLTSLAKVAPNASQTINRALPDGAYTFRLVVTDIYGKTSAPVDVTATLNSAAPGVVTNVQIVVA